MRKKSLFSSSIQTAGFSGNGTVTGTLADGQRVSTREQAPKRLKNAFRALSLDLAHDSRVDSGKDSLGAILPAYVRENAHAISSPASSQVMGINCLLPFLPVRRRGVRTLFSLFMDSS